MFRYRPYTAMGGNDGDVELAMPTVQPGERIHTGDGRKLLVLHAAYLDDEDDRSRARLTVEEVHSVGLGGQAPAPRPGATPAWPERGPNARKRFDRIMQAARSSSTTTRSHVFEVTVRRPVLCSVVAGAPQPG
jgi:hypothetical protein